MKTADGRQWANREDLIAHSGYSRATLGALWHARPGSGHPEPREFDGVMHWDLEVWDAWFAEHLRQLRERPRDLSGVDRSGDLDEQLPPAKQAKVLGVDPARITQYAKNPPPEWPDPIHVEKLPTRTREYRTRRQLLEWVDNPVSGFGTAGGRPSGPARKKTGPDPRIQIAADFLTAHPSRTPGQAAADLAAAHGQSVDTWKRIITRARKEAGQ